MHVLHALSCSNDGRCVCEGKPAALAYLTEQLPPCSHHTCDIHIWNPVPACARIQEKSQIATTNVDKQHMSLVWILIGFGIGMWVWLLIRVLSLALGYRLWVGFAHKS